ncbi:hypothetical protein JCM10908_005528 [Rhodotorula pacifica]|uniref:Bph1p n=1 Tax=Rhodotorula pacifica TaxID=1495444 RepID=UPI00316F5701
MLRRFSDAASLLTRQATPEATASSSLTPQQTPSHSPGASSGSPALDEALASDILVPTKPDFSEQSRTDLRAALRNLQDAPAWDLERRLGAVATVQLVLQEYASSSMRAAFAADGGYEIIIGSLAALGQCDDAAPKDLRFDLATLLFKVLDLVSSADESRLRQVLDSLASAFELARLAGPDSPRPDRTRVIGLLVAFACGKFSHGGQQTEILLNRAAEACESCAEPAERLEKVLHVIAESDADTSRAANRISAGLPLLLETLDRLLPTDDASVTLLRVVALVAVLRPDRISDPHDDKTVIDSGAAGVLDMALERLLPGPDRDAPRVLAPEERILWHEVAVALLDRLGAPREVAFRLFDAMISNDGINEAAAELVLEGMHAAGDPASVSFDLVGGRSSCLRLLGLEKPFPPPAHGYAFMTWVSILEGPTSTSSPLLLLSVADPSLRTFFELSVTPELRIAVRTSLKVPPVAFDDFAFIPGQLYHLAVVHQRPRFSAAAPISLYVNGQLAATLRINYPAAPPKDWKVEARLGTSADRVQPSSEARGPRWHLGPSWLVHGDLSADFVQAAHLLGPRYSGTFQDRLSRFLTTSAAAAAEVELDAQQSATVHADQSSLSSTLQQRGRNMLPQTRIYFALSAAHVLEAPSPLRPSSQDERLSIEKALMQGPSLVNVAKTGSLATVIECSDGLAVAENASFLPPQGLDDSLWAAGGTALLLRWIDFAKTTDQLETAVSTLVEALADSWRLCEEADRTRAYDVLAMLLQRQGDRISVNIHAKLLRLAGVDVSHPELSTISSSPASDRLLSNFDLWRTTSAEVQRQHISTLTRLIEFEAGAANVKKLRKLGFFRRLLLAVRTNSFDQDVAGEAAELLLSFLRLSFTVDAIRLIATYLLSSLSAPTRSSEETALKILRSMHDLLLDDHCLGSLAKWAKHIRPKWLLALLSVPALSEEALVLAIRILVRLLQVQGAAYQAQFANTDGGFTVLRGVVARRPYSDRTLVTLLALLYGYDINTVSIEMTLTDAEFAASPETVSPYAVEIARCVVAAIATGSRVAGEDHDETIDHSVELEHLERVVLRESDLRLIETPVILRDLYNTLRPSLSVSLDEEEGGPFATSSSRSYIVDAVARIAVRRIIGRDGAFESPALPPLLAQFASSDASLQPLRSIFDAAASNRKEEAVSFRSILLERCIELLAEANVTARSAGRVEGFVDAVVAFVSQGWMMRPAVLLEFALRLAERLHDDIALTGNNDTKDVLRKLMSSIDRLALICLKVPTEHALPAIELLSRYHTTFFTPRASDDKPFGSLLWRICKLGSGGTPSAPACRNLVKLLALEWSGELPPLLRGTSTEGEPQSSTARAQRAEIVFVKMQRPSRRHCWNPYVHPVAYTRQQSLISGTQSDAEMITLLKLSVEADAAHRTAYNASKDFEEMTAQTAVEREMQRLRHLDVIYGKKERSQVGRLHKRSSALHNWTQDLLDQDAIRQAHARQDRGETDAEVAQIWKRQLRNGVEAGTPGRSGLRAALDSTEGPSRQRRRIRVEPVESVATVTSPLAAPSTKGDEPSHRGNVHSEEPVCEEDNDEENDSTPLAAASELTEPEEAGIEEDKQRRILHLLAPRDKVLAVYNTSKIQGVDTIPTLLLVTAQAIHLVEDYHMRRDGEVVNSWDAPEEERDAHVQILADLAGRNTRSSRISPHSANCWTWTELVEVHERRFLFRDCSLELFFRDGRNFLLSFTDGRKNEALDDLVRHSPAAVSSGSLTTQGVSLGSRLAEAVTGQRTKLEGMTQDWLRRRVSNFDYLMFLNTVAGRTYNDLTSYPVFPWILRDYTSEELDLNDVAVYRDLSKPMGCQDARREAEFKERYSQLEALDDGSVPFHYGTHYSSAMIAAGYLIRLSPFTEAYLNLQGGAFDHADRLFWSVERAWRSASSENRSDVRELTPEFFFLPDFLSNPNRIVFGDRQENGEAVNDVELPPWAKGNPRLFVEKQREALESEYVSQHLGGWIDLVFGSKQRGPAAVDAVNVFHHLSYDGAIDLDAITDSDERKAVVSTIHNFGNTPRQLFHKPHPNRRPRLLPKATHRLFAPDLLVEDAPEALTQTATPVFADSPQPIHSIIVPPVHVAPDRVHVSRFGAVQLLDQPRLEICYSDSNGALRLQERGSSTPLACVEGGHTAAISAACFIDPARLVTASSDGTLGIWRIVLGSKADSTETEIHCDSLLRAVHRAPIACLAVSSAYAIAVSGDENGRAMLWDMNRHYALRHLDNEGPVAAIAISDTTGDIATCSANILSLWDVNGELLVAGKTGSATQAITAVAWSLSEVVPIVATGHSGGRVSLWRRAADPGSETGWKLELLVSLQIEDRLAAAQLADSPPARPPRSGAPDTIETVSALAFAPRSLYVGTVSGKVHLFNLPPTEVHVSDSSPLASACMACRSKFGLLEGRKRCSGCAGVFCSLCTTRSVEAGGRFCAHCFSRLSPLLVQ